MPCTPGEAPRWPPRRSDADTATEDAFMSPVATHCPYCALQCAQWLTVTPDASVEVAGRDFPTNRGGLCQKGWTSAELLRAGDRLTHPWVRRADGLLHPATWDEALGR